MTHFKAKQPRARVPVCWVCDRMLYAGGRIYATVTDEAGNEHPAHRSCVDGSMATVETPPTRRAAKP